MKCYCTSLTYSGLMVWKTLGIRGSWKKIDPDGIDENNYCLRWEG